MVCTRDIQCTFCRLLGRCHNLLADEYIYHCTYQVKRIGNEGPLDLHGLEEEEYYLDQDNLSRMVWNGSTVDTMEECVGCGTGRDTKVALFHFKNGHLGFARYPSACMTYVSGEGFESTVMTVCRTPAALRQWVLNQAEKDILLDGRVTSGLGENAA